MNNAGFLSIESVRENQLANLSKQIDRLEKQLQQKENIIKEVRDYILSNQNTELSVDSYFKYEDLVEFNDILRILDKEDK